MTPWRSLGSFTGPFEGYAPKPGVDHIALPIAALVPKAGETDLGQTLSLTYRFGSIDSDRISLAQGGYTPVLDWVCYSEAKRFD